MPDWYLKFWYISVLLGGLIGVGTVFLKRGTRRQLDLVLKLERGALLIIAGAIFSYVCALISSVRPLGGAIVASILVGGWMMAAIVRIIQIHISLRRLKEVDNSDEGVT